MSDDNIFSQTAETYIVSLEVKHKHISLFEEILSENSTCTTFFEKEITESTEINPEDLWSLNIYFGYEPDLRELGVKVNQLSKEINITPPMLYLDKLKDIDWVEEVQKNFKTIEAGDFFVRTDFNEACQDSTKIEIIINPGRAFGTGEHETTRGCLEMISKSKCSNNFLDLGTGSGILAIAMAKKFGQKIIASDIDKEAVRVAKDNAQLNNTENLIEFYQSDGFENLPRQKYDLITANILAKPLKEMSGNIVESLNINGEIIIAGILENQAQEIINIYELLGLKLNNKLTIGFWSILKLSLTN